MSSLLRRSCAFFVVSLASLVAQSAPAQNTGRDSIALLLYQPVDYGSEAYFTPLSAFLNKGFDHFQSRNASREFWAFPFERSLRYGAGDALAHPVAAIRRFPGWHTWLSEEVLPFAYSTTSSRWAANYTEHFIAGGLTYRRLNEWYRLHGVPASRAFAGATTFAAALMNEAAEHTSATAGASSTVADLYVFDLGGLIAFNWDPLVRFFAGTLQMSDWSNMASLTIPDGGLRNSGQYYIAKLPLPKTETRAFVRFGMGIQGGLSRHVSAENSVTLALGADTEARTVDPTTRDESIVLRFGGGLYVDRNNSLLASVTAGPAANRLVVNVYPGVLPGAGRDLGVWAAQTYDGHFIAGVVSRRMLGLGLGYAR